MTEVFPIRRAFVEVGHGQMHYRSVGEGAPLIMLHASPGSSRQLVKLIEDFAGVARIIAPDTPGNGDSDALALDTPTIVDLAKGVLTFLDAMGLEKIDLYGSHTGGTIAAELAILAPERVNRVIIDGVMVLTDDELQELLEIYAHPFPADLEGAYLARIFQFCRDQYLFFPWYKRTRAARRDNGLGSAEDIRAWVIEVLKASETYHLNYRAAFRWDAASRLPLVKCPTLLMAAENDPLFDSTRKMLPALSTGGFMSLPRLDAPDFRQRRKEAMQTFLSKSADASIGTS